MQDGIGHSGSRPWQSRSPSACDVARSRQRRSGLNRRQFLAAVLLTPALIVPSPVAAQNATPVPESPPLIPLPEASPRADAPIRVLATTPILADIARQVGGARVDAESLLPENADAHDFEPAPADIVKIEDAALVIEHGLELDTWAADLVESAGEKQVVVATDGVTTIPAGGEDSSSVDPHVWFDPMNVKVMAANIAAALIALDPDGQGSYEARRNAYALQLDELDRWIMAQIATIPLERRKLVTNHDAFGYYVQRYGLTFVGSVIGGIDSRAEPSAKEVAELIEKIKMENVPAIFTEASINPELEEELAAQAGVAVFPNLYADNLGEAGSGADTYVAMMVANTRLIVSALRPAE